MRVSGPRADVKELLAITHQRAGGRLAIVGRREVARLLAGGVVVAVLSLGQEEAEPLVADRVDEPIGDRVIHEDPEARLVHRARESSRRIVRGVVDHSQLHGNRDAS